jgi:hypothetical protein
MSTVNNLPLLDGLEPEIVQTLVTRREAITRTSKFGAAALATATLPVALAGLARSAYGQAPTSVVGVLQFALLLENLEAEFYKAVLGTSAVAAFNTAFAPVRATFNATETASLTLLRDHEIKHVAFLQAAITGAGATPTIYPPATTFDFTGNRGVGGAGPFAPATVDKGFLLAATQGFEDTGVRAYKGQAGFLLNTRTLQEALRIHSLEAKHAARIRRMRRAANTGATSLRYSGTVQGDGATAAGGGVPAASTNVPAASVTALTNAFNLIYAGEGNTTHTVNNGSADVPLNASTLPGLSGGADVTLAFDEPLTRAQVIAIIQPFVIPTLS